MFQHILVPLDGSRTSRFALDKAAALSKAFGSRVTLANVVDLYPFAHGGTELTMSRTAYSEAASANAETLLAEGREALASLGVAADCRRIDGHAPHDGILDLAKATEADLIVMGSHGRHGVARLLLGSVAQRVLSHATVPVLVVRGGD